MKAQTIRTFGARWYSIPLLLLAWQWAVSSGSVNSRLVPSVLQVAGVLFTEIKNGTLVYHASVTLGRALGGFALAAVVGVPFAAAMARSSLCRNLFEPIFFFGYPIPKIALFPIFTYVFGFGTPSKVSFTFLECLYPIVVTSLLRLSRNSDPPHLDCAKFRCQPMDGVVAGHSAGRAPRHLFRSAHRPSDLHHRRCVDRDDRQFDWAGLLHHAVEHAIHLSERLCRHYRYRRMRLYARPDTRLAARPFRSPGTRSSGVSHTRAPAVRWEVELRAKLV